MAQRFAIILFATGAALLGTNLLGFVHHTEIENGDWVVFDSRPRTLSADEFWEEARRGPDESEDSYVRRLTDLISDRFLLADSAHTKPTFFENWLLWNRARSRGEYEWTDTRRAVRLGGGFCSQHAIVFDNILNDQGIESRILALSGHVVNEARIDERWRVCDPDYGIVFDHSLEALERSPETVYEVYRAWGRPHDEAEGWREIFATRDDNTAYESAVDYRGDDASFERAALYLVWIVPIALLAAGGFCAAIHARNRVGVNPIEDEVDPVSHQ
ncbi:MAG: hypothetical protein CME06_11255 [Gemmatimonadetes bacterium]|nr:hypothetical protein [Gemmatimonadota bacterium]